MCHYSSMNVKNGTAKIQFSVESEGLQIPVAAAGVLAKKSIASQ